MTSARAVSSSRRRAASSRAATFSESRRRDLLEARAHEPAALVDTGETDLEVGAKGSDPGALLLEAFTCSCHLRRSCRQLLLGGLDLGEPGGEILDAPVFALEALGELRQVSDEGVEFALCLVAVAGEAPNRLVERSTMRFVGVDGAGCLLLGAAGLGQGRTRHVGGATQLVVALLGLDAPFAGLVERSARRAAARCTDPPAGRPESVAATGDDDEIGVCGRDLHRLVPAAVHGHRPAEHHVEQCLHPRRIAARRQRPDVGAHRLAHTDGGRESLATSAEREHCAAVVSPGERRQRSGRCCGVGDHDGGERLAGCGVEGLLPTGVDRDELAERSEHPVEIRELLGPRTLAGFVERQGEGLDPSLPAGPFGLCAVRLGLGPLQFRLGAAAGRPSRLEPRDQVGVARLGQRQRLGGVGGLEPQTLATLLESGATGVQAFLVVTAPLDRRTQGRELAAETGRLAGGRGHTLAPVGLEAQPLVGQLAIALLQTLGRLDQVGTIEFDLLGLREELGVLGLERCDHRSVDRRAELAFDPASPFRQQRRQPAPLLAQRLEPDQVVAEVPATERGELRLGRHDLGIELGQPGAQALVLVAQLRSGRADGLELGPQPLDLAPAEVQPQRRQLVDHRTVAPSGISLAFEGTELTPDLAHQVLDPGQVRLGGGQPPFRSFLAAAELQHAGRFLDDESAILGPGVEDAVDVALGDDHVLLATDSRVGQQFLDVEQPARDPVDRVLAVTRAEQQSGEGHLGEVDGELAARVVDRQ